MIRSQGGADVLLSMMLVMMLSMMMLTIHLCHVYRKLRKQRWTNRGTNTWKHSMPPFPIKGRQRQRMLTLWLLLTHRPTLVCVPHRDNSFLREFLLLSNPLSSSSSRSSSPSRWSSRCIWWWWLWRFPHRPQPVSPCALWGSTGSGCWQTEAFDCKHLFNFNLLLQVTLWQQILEFLGNLGSRNKYDKSIKEKKTNNNRYIFKNI